MGRTPPAVSRPRPRYMVVRLAIGLGLFAYLGLSGAIDWARLPGLVHAWPLTVAALLLLFLVVLGASWRLCLLLAGQGYRLGFGASVRLSLVGALFGNILPGSSGGDLARIWLATRPNDGRRTEITTTLLLDRLIGLAALLSMPLVIALPGRRLIPRTAPIGGLLLGSVAALVLLVAVIGFGVHPDGVLRRSVTRLLARTRAGSHAERVFESIRALRDNVPAVLSAFALSLAMQALVIAAIQLILLAHGARSPNWGAAVLTPFGMLANALPLTPGGLGVGEAAFESLFRFAGVMGGAEAILSWRLLTTFIDLCGGAILIAGRTDVRVTGPAAAPAGSHR